MDHLRLVAPPELPVGFVPNVEQPTVKSPFGVLRRRAGLFGATVAAFVALVIIAVLLSPKTYSTSVKLIAGNSQQSAVPNAGGQTILPVLNAILDASNAQSSETYAEMLRQTPALEKTIAKEKLSITPAQLLDRVKVKPVTNTAILSVSVAWNDPVGSARIANSLADSFVDVRRDLITAQADGAIAYIGQQLPDARAKLARSATALAQFESRNEIADADTQTQAMVATLTDVDRKIASVAVDKGQAAAQLAVVRGQLAKTPATVSGGHQIAPNPAVGQLQTQLAQVDVQLRTALSQYTDEHPTVRSLRAQEEQLKRELAKAPATLVSQDTTIPNPMRQTLMQSAATLGSQLASDTAQLKLLQQQREGAKPAMRALPGRIAQLVELKRQAKLDEDTFNALQQKLSQAQIARSTTLSDISVIARANPAEATVTPNVLLDIAAGIVLSVFLGLTVVLIAERLDGSIKTEQDVVDRLGLPVLSSIPQLPERANRPRWLEASTVDAFLQLVTALRYASSERLSTIAFTSADAEGGKSTVALKAAIAMAELTPRVLLVDADLRLPSIHDKLGMRRTTGLSDVLVGTLGFTESIRSTPHAGLDVVVAGTSVPNPFALLQSPAFDRFLEEAKKHYELVVLDTPACGAVVDAAVVCARADGTVYVVASRQTDATQAERGLTRLRSAGVRNIVGAVLNRAPAQRTTIGAYGTDEEGRPIVPLPRPRDAQSS